jgi:hypothetical protein
VLQHTKSHMHSTCSLINRGKPASNYLSVASIKPTKPIASPAVRLHELHAALAVMHSRSKDALHYASLLASAILAIGCAIWSRQYVAASCCMSPS